MVAALIIIIVVTILLLALSSLAYTKEVQAPQYSSFGLNVRR